MYLNEANIPLTYYVSKAMSLLSIDFVLLISINQIFVSGDRVFIIALYMTFSELYQSGNVLFQDYWLSIVLPRLNHCQCKIISHEYIFLFLISFLLISITGYVLFCAWCMLHFLYLWGERQVLSPMHLPYVSLLPVSFSPSLFLQFFSALFFFSLFSHSWTLSTLHLLSHPSFFSPVYRNGGL